MPPQPLPDQPPPAPPEAVDGDHDGIPDDEELTIGTDPLTPDTDNDNLSDRDELRTYKTDPLNADSDGDTYTDGDEVRNGYNPKGSGMLFEVPGAR